MRNFGQGICLSLVGVLVAVSGSMWIGCDLLSDSSKESSTGNDVLAMDADDEPELDLTAADIHFGAASCTTKVCTIEGSTLEWQAQGSDDWFYPDEAKDYCETLTLAGVTDWRLPNIDELRTLIRGAPATEFGGACAVSEGCNGSAFCHNETVCGDNALKQGPGPEGCYWPEELLGECDIYWSTTKVAEFSSIFDVDFTTGAIQEGLSMGVAKARCVRGSEVFSSL